MQLRRSFRMLYRNPAFSLAVILMLAIGIGANTAIFGVLDRLLLRPLPFTNQDQLVAVENSWPLFLKSSGGEPKSTADDAFEALAKYELGRVTLGGSTSPEVIRVARSTRQYFSLLGSSPQVGRYFSNIDRKDQDDKVVVLSNRLWRRFFNQDPSVVGKQLTLNGRSFTVTAVTAPDFLFLVRGEEADAWIPYVDDDPLVKSAQVEGSGAIARLRSGLTLAEAQSRSDLVFQRISQTQPELRLTQKDRMSLVPLRDYWFGNLKAPLLMLLAAAVCLLLIAAANITSLMLARSATRQKDMAIRAALGAGRFQLIKQSLSESLLLGILGGLLGLTISWLGIKAMVSLSPVRIPHPEQIGLNLRIVLFAFLIAFPAAMIPGLISAWSISRRSLTSVINEGSARSGAFISPRLRKLLVISEVAITVLVLVNAGLLFRSLRVVLHESLGFNTQNVLTLEIAPVETKYPDRQKRSVLYQDVINRVGTLPGVAHVGTVNYLPIFSGSLIIPINLQERDVSPEQGFSWSYRIASADYFQTMTIPVIAGRTFSEHDGVDANRVAVIDQSAAKFLNERFFPNESVIGKHLVLAFDKPTAFEIVGVVGDIRQQGLEIATYPGFYLHALQRPPSVSNLVVRTNSDPVSISRSIRSTIAEVDRDLPVSSLRMLENEVTESVSRRRFAVFLAGVLGAAALVLSMIGLYSLMSHVVSHRTHEIGVRMALGAGVVDVLRLIGRQAFSLVGIGIAVGLLTSFATSRIIASLLFGVSSSDPVTLVVVALVLLLIALLACYLPARRAMKIDPIEALRCE